MSDSTTSIYETKLQASGLTLLEAFDLNIEFLDPEETKSLSPTFKKQAALKLNYFGPDRKPLSDIPSADNYYRLRYLYNLKGFAAATSPQRYANLPNTLPVAYWPQNAHWGSVLDDTSAPLVIVEGELKAAKACKEGFHTIALSGVDSWCSRKRGCLFIESLECIDYLRRDVYICFDSDYVSNKGIVRAINALTEKLIERGAFVHIVTLPSLPGLDKTGLDDYFVYFGKEGVTNFNLLLANAQPVGLSRSFLDFNDKYVVLSNPAGVYDKYTQTIYKPETFKNCIASHKNTLVRTAEAAQKGSYKPVYKYKPINVGKEWLSWPLSDRCDALVYLPGAGQYVEKAIREQNYVDYNCWSGWGAEPVEGDVSLFLELVDYMFKDSPSENMEWFLQWLAYPIQHPGAKLNTACAIHGTVQGTGKTLVGYTVGGVYGNNYKEVSQTALESDFQKPFINRQFVLGDEITGNDQRKFADKLKQFITGHEILVNDKFITQYYIRNCINFYFTSNHPNAFYLEDSDRRYFIHKAPDKLMSKSFYKKYDKWFRTATIPQKPRQEAMNALMYYFVNLDTSTFEPNAPAPSTNSKELMRELSQSDLGSWVRQAKEHPAELLCNSARDIFNSKELLMMYDPMGKTRVTANGLARELTYANVSVANEGKKITTKTSVVRYYILRNVDKWLHADLPAIREHLVSKRVFLEGSSKH